MQKFLIFVSIFFSYCFVQGQSFSGSGGSIPGSSTTQTCFPINVAGIGNINTTINGLASVCLTIIHPNVDELEILIKAPDGTVVPLTIQNGGTGNNYTNTCFTATAATSVKFATAPFTGTFLPEGYLGSVNNGQNANGAWRLCIQDRRNNGNAGTLNNWQISFNNTPAPLPPAIAACSTILPSTSSCATATTICDFNGLCGSTLGGTIQDWTGSGLSGCFGLQNNSFIKFIASATTASFTVWVPTNSGGVDGGIQMLFFSGACGSGAVTTHGCYPHIFPYQSAALPLATIVSATGLTVGNTYYLMTDGFNSDQTTFRIAANTGVNILNISPTNPSICNGKSVNLTATGGNGTYSWSPATGLNTTTGATVSANPVTSTLYTVTSSTSGGCPLTKDVNVVVNDTPLVTAHPSIAPQNICLNGPVNALSVVANAGSGTISNYQWYITTAANNTGGAPIPFATSATYTPSSASVGTIYFYCRITNSNGCSTKSDISGQVKVSSLVTTPTATATIQPTCTTATGTIVVTAPAGINIEYSDGGAYQASGTFSGLAPGPYNITARNKISGCISSIRIVTVNALPPGPSLPTGSVTVQPDCVIPTATIVVTTPVGINLEYSVAGTYQSGTTFTGLTNGTVYNVTVRDTITGCISAALPLTVNNIPGAPVAPSTVLIQPTCLLSTGSITITAPTGANFEYSNGGGYQPGLIFSGLTAGTSYAVTVKDNASGCVSAPANITIDAIPATTAAPVVSSQVPYCENAAAVPLSATGTNLLWYTTAIGGTGTATAPTPLTTGVSSIIYYVSQTVAGCESPRAAITVTTNGLPVAPTISTPVSYCTNEGTSPLTATGTGLLWYTTAAGGIGTSTAPTPLSTTFGSTLYYVTQTINNCEGPRAVITVTINATPAAPAVTSPVVYCENLPAVALTATGSSLLWYNVATGGTGTTTAPIPSTTATGNTIYYVSQSINGCEGPRTAKTVTINALPAAPTITTPVVYCQNAPASALSATGTSLRWYTVATGGTASLIAPVPPTNAPGNSTYYISQTINGCEGPRAAMVVTINATPATPVITSPVFYCENNTAVPLTATGSNLLWYNTATSTAGSTTAPTPATTTAANTFYYVSQTILGCEGPKAAITVTVSPTINPVTSFKYNPDTVCANGINPGPVYGVGFRNGGVFSSSTGLAVNAANGNINLSASTPNTYIVTYTYTANGCTLGGSSTSSITIKPQVSTNTIFSYNSPVCINGINPAPSVTGAFTTGGTYNSTTGLSINTNTGVINLAASTPKTYQITYSLPTLGCRLATSNFSFITIQANTSPVTVFSYSPAAVCPGDNNPVLTRNTGFALGGTFAAVPAGLSIDAVSGAINVAASSTGVYKITYSVLAAGCRVADSTTTTFIVRSATPPNTTFSYDSPVCKNDVTAIPVTSATFSAGGVFSSTTGLAINAATGIVDLAGSNSGNFVIKYALQSSACSVAAADSASITIITQPQPPALIPLSICNPGVVVLNATGSGIIKWYADAASTNLLNTGNSFSTNLTASTSYYLTNTVGTCTSATFLANVKLSNTPAAPALGIDTSICTGDALVLFAGLYNNYLWQDDSKQPTYTVTNSGIYSVTVSNSEGCTNSSSIEVEVLTNCDDIYFPSAFSPNDDGINEKFGPLGNLFVVSNYSLKIFNRYGEMVFQTNNPNQKWDGTIAGKKYGNINFVWVANYRYRGKIAKTQRGNVLIVK